MLARFRGRGPTAEESLLELNGEADHVHLLIARPPNPDLSNFVNTLKAISSGLRRQEFADKAKWSTQARLPASLVLHHFVRWRSVLDPQTTETEHDNPR
jgi:REP element-mobilizing transposase RayT